MEFCQFILLYFLFINLVLRKQFQSKNKIVMHKFTFIRIRWRKLQSKFNRNRTKGRIYRGEKTRRRESLSLIRSSDNKSRSRDHSIFQQPCRRVFLLAQTTSSHSDIHQNSLIPSRFFSLNITKPLTNHYPARSLQLDQLVSCFASLVTKTLADSRRHHRIHGFHHEISSSSTGCIGCEYIQARIERERWQRSAG